MCVFFRINCLNLIYFFYKKLISHSYFCFSPFWFSTFFFGQENWEAIKKNPQKITKACRRRGIASYFLFLSSLQKFGKFKIAVWSIKTITFINHKKQH